MSEVHLKNEDGSVSVFQGDKEVRRYNLSPAELEFMEYESRRSKLLEYTLSQMVPLPGWTIEGWAARARVRFAKLFPAQAKDFWKVPPRADFSLSEFQAELKMKQSLK